MFGSGFPCSMPLCSQPSPMMCSYDVPVPQPYACPYPVPQPYLQNIIQPVDVPVQSTIQPIIVPTPVNIPVPQPVPVPIDRPCAVPIPQPFPVPIDRPCAVQVPVCVPVPQPCPVPQPYIVREQVCVPVPTPVPVPVAAPPPSYMIQEEYYLPEYEEEYEEEPICIKRCRRRHRRHRHRDCRPPAPLPPIIIPIPIQAPQEQVPLQVTEYVQDIYPPAEVYTDQVPVGYMANDRIIPQPPMIQTQQTTHCRPGMILPPAPFQAHHQQQIVQQLPSGQMVQRPLSIGGSPCVQTVMSQPNLIPVSSSSSFVNGLPAGAQIIS